MRSKKFETGFQFLLNTLRHPESKNAMASILWTGASLNVGVSTLLLNFTSYIARNMGWSVLLCDANFKNNSLSALWNLQHNKPGLTEVLTGKARPEEVIHRTEIPGLYVLPSGDSSLLPTIMGSRHIQPRETIRKLSESFGFVVMDSAPPNFSPASCFLSSQVDGVLIVVNAGKTRREVVKATTERLESAGANIVGGVLNRRKYYIPEWIYRQIG